MLRLAEWDWQLPRWLRHPGKAAADREGLLQGQKEEKAVKACKTSLEISNKP